MYLCTCMKKKRRNVVVAALLGAGLALGMLMSSCGGGQQMRSYTSELTSDDSIMIRMGDWNLIRYHSEKLGLDISYPSFLYRQDLPEEPAQELFMFEDISISVVVDSLQGMTLSAGQQMMGMGAELLESGDDYSIQQGSERDWDYYGKVMDDDSTRLVTIMLRYAPNHAEAVEPLKEWVREYKLK